MPPSPAPVRSSGYKPRKSKGGALWMVLILAIAGIGGLWVFAPEIPRRLLGMAGLTPSLKSQIIGTWQADEGYTISFTSDTFTAKDGTRSPYTWEAGSFQTRTIGKVDVLSGNFEIDGGQVKITPRAVIGGGGNSLLLIIGDRTISYRRAGAGGASPSANASQTTSDTESPKPKDSAGDSVPAKEVDLSKIIAITKNSALTELQKETQFEDYSGLIAVTGKITSSMRSPVDKSRLQIFICPIDSDHNRNYSRDIRCDVSAFSKEVMAAAPGTPVRITGQAKYASGMSEFVVRDSKAELITTQLPKSGAGGAGTIPSSTPVVSTPKPKEETSPTTPVDDEDKKREAEATAMRANLLRSAGLKDNVRKPEEKPAEIGAPEKPTATDPLAIARSRGHEIAVKMVANQNAAKQLMSDVANASRQNDTSQIQSLQRQLERLQRTGARLDAEGMEYAKTLTQAERDAFLEGFQSARAGK